MERRDRSTRASEAAADLDRSEGFLTRGLGGFVPEPVAKRAIAVSIETDRDTYARDQPVSITVTFRNRLPLPVTVPTPTSRRWGWTVDGQLEGSDQRRYTPDAPSAFSFGPGERKRASVEWNGRFERTRGDHEWVLPEPGTYELTAFVATDPGGYRPRDATTIEIR